MKKQLARIAQSSLTVGLALVILFGGLWILRWLAQVMGEYFKR